MNILVEDAGNAIVATFSDVLVLRVTGAAAGAGTASGGVAGAEANSSLIVEVPKDVAPSMITAVIHAAGPVRYTEQGGESPSQC